MYVLPLDMKSYFEPHTDDGTREREEDEQEERRREKPPSPQQTNVYFRTKNEHITQMSSFQSLTDRVNIFAWHAIDQEVVRLFHSSSHIVVEGRECEREGERKRKTRQESFKLKKSRIIYPS